MKGVDWDKAREIQEQTRGKRLMIDERKRLFKAGKVYDVKLEDLENELVREIIRRLNKEAREEGRFGDQLFNFTRVLEDGEKEQYYEEFDEATPQELAELSTREFKKANKQMDKFFEIHDRATGKYGREYTNLLAFAVPKRRPKPTAR
jgi:hypothetical protein